MLPEEEALALIKRHCGPLSEAKWIGPALDDEDDWDNAVCERVSLIVEPKLMLEETTERAELLEGARLRLALGVAQAVSCCRGVEPATNQRFWREVVKTLWPKTGRSIHSSNHCWAKPDSNQIAVLPSTFMHVGIQWMRTCPAHDTFWIGFFHGMPDQSALIQSVLDQLAPHFAAGVPPPSLRVSLSRCFSEYYRYQRQYRDDRYSHSLKKKSRADPVVSPVALRAILRAALDTSTAHWSVATRVGLVIDYSVDDDPAETHEMLDLLKRTRIEAPPYLELTVDRLAVQLTPPAPLTTARLRTRERSLPYFVTRGRALGELLGILLRNEPKVMPQVHTVAVRGCSGSYRGLVGAVLSAVALATPPVTELRCSGLFNVKKPQDQLVHLAWLVYTLHRRERHTRCIAGSRRVPLALSLQSFGVAITDRESAYMRQLVQQGTPLREGVDEMLRLWCDGDDEIVAKLQVEWMSDGAIVRFARGTHLYFRPFVDFDDHVAVELGLAAADEEHEFDLIAHVVDQETAAFVGVVYAGYGLVWAEAACVIAEQPARDTDVDLDVVGGGEGRGVGGSVQVSSLALSFEVSGPRIPADSLSSAYRVVAMLSVLGSSGLRTLSLDRVVLPRADLVAILEQFPLLESLALSRCAIVSINPLLDAYSSATARRPRARPAVLLLSDVCNLRDLEQQSQVNTPFEIDSAAVYEAHGAAVSAPEWVVRLVDALALGLAAGRLRELHVDFSTMKEYTGERIVTWSLTRAVASTAHVQSLWRLHVAFQSRPTMLGTQLLTPLRNDAVVVCPLPPRVRCAVLSVLRAVDCCVRNVAESVLAFAEHKSERLVTWCDSA